MNKLLLLTLTLSFTLQANPLPQKVLDYNQLYVQKERCMMLARLVKKEGLQGLDYTSYSFDIKECIKIVKKYKQLE